MPWPDVVRHALAAGETVAGVRCEKNPVTKFLLILPVARDRRKQVKSSGPCRRHGVLSTWRPPPAVASPGFLDTAKRRHDIPPNRIAPPPAADRLGLVHGDPRRPVPTAWARSLCQRPSRDRTRPPGGRRLGKVGSTCQAKRGVGTTHPRRWGASSGDRRGGHAGGLFGGRRASLWPGLWLRPPGRLQPASARRVHDASPIRHR